MAVSRRKKKKGRAATFLLLAGLTLLIAAFIARRTVLKLISEDAQTPAAAIADTGAPPEPGAGSGPNVPDDAHRYAGASDRTAAGATHDRNDPNKDAAKNHPGEHITGSERRQLDTLIREKSR